MRMQLTSDQQSIIDAGGHLLVEGGPGSGKTTVALLKAAKLTGGLKPGQKVLFLSFSRAAVARVLNAMTGLVNREQEGLIKVDTYHSFFWRIIKTHSYLLDLPRSLSILTGEDEASALANIRRNSGDEEAERWRLCREEGKVSFDCFSKVAADILKRSHSIAKHYSECFPFVLLDEFQDTTDGQWDVVQSLGKRSTLIALCDNEQRIYGWMYGANDKRPKQFCNIYANAQKFDLASNNHRSKSTDIAVFGNDVMTGNNLNKSYSDVAIVQFSNSPKLPIHTIKDQVSFAISRQQSTNHNWSVAILTPTKQQVRRLSRDLNDDTGNIPPINHSTIIDMEGVILAAKIVAHLLRPVIRSDYEDKRREFVELLCNYLRGRKGGKPSKGDLNKASQFEREIGDGSRLSSNSQLKRILERFDEICNLSLTGVPEDDWRNVRNQLGELPHLENKLLEDARDVPLLERGRDLSVNLASDWRENSCYQNASQIVKDAFRSLQLNYDSRVEKGVIITNIDKVKGKQFSEVIIIERYPSPYAGALVHDEIVTEADKMKLRVAVTRAEKKVTILTPNHPRSPIL